MSGASPPVPPVRSGTLNRMAFIDSQPDAELRAFHRQRTSPYGIGAAAWIDETEPDRDGMRIRLILADGRQNEDGTNRHRHMLTSIARLTKVDQDELERAVERRAGDFEHDHRLVHIADRYEDDPMVLRVEWCETCDAKGRRADSTCPACDGRGYSLQ